MEILEFSTRDATLCFTASSDHGLKVAEFRHVNNISTTATLWPVGCGSSSLQHESPACEDSTYRPAQSSDLPASAPDTSPAPTLHGRVDFKNMFLRRKQACNMVACHAEGADARKRF